MKKPSTPIIEGKCQMITNDDSKKLLMPHEITNHEVLIEVHAERKPQLSPEKELHDETATPVMTSDQIQFASVWVQGDPPELLMELAGYSASKANSELVISHYDEINIRVFQDRKALTEQEQNRGRNAVRQRHSRRRKKEFGLRQSVEASSFHNGIPIDANNDNSLQIAVRDAIAELPEEPMELRIIAVCNLLHQVPMEELAKRLNRSLRSLYRLRLSVQQILRRSLNEYSRVYRE